MGKRPQKLAGREGGRGQNSDRQACLRGGLVSLELFDTHFALLPTTALGDLEAVVSPPRADEETQALVDHRTHPRSHGLSVTQADWSLGLLIPSLRLLVRSHGQ